MKILVFGATGRTGRHIVRQALRQGYIVGAFARNPKNLDMQHENLRIIKGDVFNPDSVESAVKGHDAVLCALGTRSRLPTKMLSEGTGNIIKAMEKYHVRRFVCLTSAGVLDSDGGFLLGKVMIPVLWKHVFADKRRQLEEVMKSDLDWIAVRAVKLTDGPRTKKYHAALVRPIKNRVSRANVADFMLKQVTSDKFLREMPIVSD